MFRRVSAARRRASARWAAVLAGVALLASLPALIGARPAAGDPDVTATQLVERIRSSASVDHTGYAESVGTLAIPDLATAGDLADLLGSKQRLRVWWDSRTRFRVDELGIATEQSTYADPAGTWQWDSARNRATRVVGDPGVRVPRAADVLPDELGRRLTGAVLPGEASRIPPRRVAGIDALGLRITPRDPRTTVASVDVWADPGTGLPLWVEVTPRGQSAPSLTSSYLDLALVAPDPAVLTFVPPASATVRTTPAPDIAAQANAFAPYSLPEVLAGLRRTDRIGVLSSEGGVATYGDGLGTFVVIPLPHDLGHQTQDRLGPPYATEVPLGKAVTTPLANLLVGGQRRQYLLAGTVTADVLTAALTSLVADPPPRRR